MFWEYLNKLVWTFRAGSLGLKVLDTFGNCQRLVFSLGVFQHMHKITNLLNLDSVGHRSQLRENNERKNIFVLQLIMVLSDA